MKEETFLHVSPVFNRESILKYGLIPHKPSLNHHAKTFLDFGMFQTLEDKMLYMWERCDKDNKFIKDAIYYFTWIKPRNAIHQQNDYNIIDPRLFLCSFTEMLYDVYEVKNITEVSRGIRDLHWQEPSNDRYSSIFNMDDKYAHKDKTLIFSRSIEQDIKIIKQASFEYINGKYRIKILKNINV
jgi:hypothetical protein